MSLDPSHQAIPGEHPLAGEYRLLREWESRWRPELNRVRRVFEVPAAPEDLAAVAQALGRDFRWRHTGDEGRYDRWPACFVMATVGVATNSYHAGTFWSELWKTTGLPPAVRKDREWGQEFLQSLRTLGLDQSVRPHRARGAIYVSAALLHAGIPTYCLDDLFELLVSEQRRNDHLDAASQRGRILSTEYLLHSLDAPVRHFLRDEPQHAIDILDRCMKLLTLLRRSRSIPIQPGHHDHLSLSTEAWRHVGLTKRFQRPAARALEREHTGEPREIRTIHRRRPRVCFSPELREVQIRLPLEGTASTTQGEDLERLPEEPGADEGVEFLVSDPQTCVLVTTEQEGPIHALTVAPEDDPLLIFTDKGEQANFAKGLPTGKLWVLHPRDSLAVSEGVQIVYRDGLPGGWYAWDVSYADVPTGSWIRAGSGPEHRTTSASTLLPALNHPEPLPGVFGPGGLPVHTQAPDLSLPPLSGRQWEIEVSALDSTSTPMSVRQVPGGVHFPPLFELPEPRLGAFTIRVRDGKDVRGTWSYVLAEGITVTHDPPLRRFDGPCLEAALTRVRTPSGVSTTTPVIRFEADDREARPFRLHGSQGELSLSADVPRLQVRQSHTAENDASDWSDHPLRLSPDSVAGGGDLLVRYSSGQEIQGRPRLALIDVNGRILQEESPRERRQAPDLRYPLGRFHETVRTSSPLSLVLQCGTAQFGVATIAHPPLALRATFGSDDSIRLHGAAPSTALTAALYQVYAPWRKPLVLHVSPAGTISMEPYFDVGGPLQVLLRERTPGQDGVPDRWPAWPSQGHGTSPGGTAHDATLIECTMPGRPNSIDPDEDALCRFLAEGKLSETLSRDLTAENNRRILLADRFLGAGTAQDLRSRVTRLRRRVRTPEEERPILLDSCLDLSSTPAVSARSLVVDGLASTRPATAVTPEILCRLWDSDPVRAALFSGSLISTAPLTEPPQPTALVLDAVIRNCGDTAEGLIRGLPEPKLVPLRRSPNSKETGKEEGKTMGKLRTLVREAVKDNGGFLDPATRDFVQQGVFRADPAHLKSLASRGRNVFPAVHTLCRSMGGLYEKSISQALAYRKGSPRSNGQQVSALSFALAVNGRLAARNIRSAAGLDRTSRTLWAELARAHPELTAIDLVLAELTIAGADRATLHKKEDGA